MFCETAARGETAVRTLGPPPPHPGPPTAAPWAPHRRTLGPPPPHPGPPTAAPWAPHRRTLGPPPPHPGPPNAAPWAPNAAPWAPNAAPWAPNAAPWAPTPRSQKKWLHFVVKSGCVRFLVRPCGRCSAGTVHRETRNRKKALSTSFEKTCKSRLRGCFFKVGLAVSAFGTPVYGLSRGLNTRELTSAIRGLVNKRSRTCFRDPPKVKDLKVPPMCFGGVFALFSCTHRRVVWLCAPVSTNRRGRLSPFSPIFRIL